MITLLFNKARNREDDVSVKYLNVKYKTKRKDEVIECCKDGDRILTKEFSLFENQGEIYRIPFTSVYITNNAHGDNEYMLWAEEHLIRQDRLLEVPNIRYNDIHWDENIKLMSCDRNVLKCTTVFNNRDTFLNIGYTYEQLFKMAKYGNLELFAYRLLLFFCKDIYQLKDFSADDIYYFYGDVLNNIVICDNDIYLKESCSIKIDNNVEVKFNLGKIKGLTEEIENGVITMVTCKEKDNKYCIQYMPTETDLIYLSDFKPYKVIDIKSLEDEDEDDLYNLFKVIVPGWEPGKTYSNLFCDTKPKNLNDVKWN